MLTFNDVIKRKLKDPEFREGYRLREIQEDITLAMEQENVSIEQLSEKTGICSKKLRRIFYDIDRVDIGTLQKVVRCLGHELELNFA